MSSEGAESPSFEKHCSREGGVALGEAFQRSVHVGQELIKSKQKKRLKQKHGVVGCPGCLRELPCLPEEGRMSHSVGAVTLHPEG